MRNLVIVVAAVLCLAAITPLVSLMWFRMRFQREFGENRGTYVSDQPALTHHLDQSDRAYIDERVKEYFNHAKVPYTNAKDVHVVTMLHPAEPLFLRFDLSEKDCLKFIKSCKRLSVQNQLQSDKWKELIGGYRYTLEQSPFNQIAWWSPSVNERKNLELYEGKLAWRNTQEGQIGDPYFALVNRRTGRVYLAGW